MKVYLWGIGNGFDKALHTLRKENKVLGVIDNNPELYLKIHRGYRIYSWETIEQEYDYIIITIVQYKAVLYQLMQANVDMKKIICYYDMNCWSEEKSDLFHTELWKIDILEQRLHQLERISNIRLKNMRYEIISDMKSKEYKFPMIAEGKEAVKQIVDQKKSIIRFGDGEFEIMAGKNRPVFQKYDEQLSKRLMQTIQTDDSRILLAIANNYGNLDQYTDDVADAIREYMTDEVREFHASILDFDRMYYDAYLFKCYFPYKDKSGTADRVQLVKQIWNDRDVVIVEGAETRAGVGNDLFDNVKSLKRILCPTQNAYACYEEILTTILQMHLDKNTLILTILGPAGKVLSYDLVQEGYQVVDVGQIDMDYEWYLAGQEIRVPIANKYVSQLPPAMVGEIKDSVYEEQIIARIG